MTITVKQLIDELQKYSEDTIVVKDGHGDFINLYDDISLGVKLVLVKLAERSQYRYGKYVGDENGEIEVLHIS